MKYIRGLKIGGLQQKIFNLVLIFVLALIAAYSIASYQQYIALGNTVAETAELQQASISSVSEETMQAVLENSVTQTTALNATIAETLFSDVRCDVQLIGDYVAELFEHRDNINISDYTPKRFMPNAALDGTPQLQLQHEAGVDPSESEDMALLSRIGSLLLSMYKSYDSRVAFFAASTDGNILLANSSSGANFDQDGNFVCLEVRQRPFYVQAVEAGEQIYTGVEIDAYEKAPSVACAIPIYADGELVAVVGANILLSYIESYIGDIGNESGFLCAIDDKGHVIFSGAEEGTFRATLAADSHDLRADSNKELADLVSRAMNEKVDITPLTVDGREYYAFASPMSEVGWTFISLVDAAMTRQPTELLLSEYDAINAQATVRFQSSLEGSFRRIVIIVLILLLTATVGALVMAQRIVKPVETMTKRIRSISGGDQLFEMEDVYKTGDEIEVLAEAFVAISKKTRDYIKQIIEITAEKERIGVELALATRIQADMLPNIFPAFPERKEFDIYASMDPAREVGGDFYDYFLIDDTHLGIVMADVSGKGVPAALFMMISKILAQNYAMTGRSPAQVLQAVNNQICSNNREEMFVTVWFGILDTTTGVITAANAGHEYPVLMQPGGGFELVKDKHGLVIGGMEGIKYKEYEMMMEPGAKLFLYTDGVPEATNAENELFGTGRMLEALNADIAATPEELLKNVRRAVDSFVNGAEQFDDITMLGLEYRGTKERHK